MFFFGFIGRRPMPLFLFFFFLSRRRLFRFAPRLLFFFFFGLLFLFRFLFFFLRLFFFFFLWGFFAFFIDKRDLVADIHFPAFVDVNLGKRSVLGRFPFHRRLVGLDFCDHFAGRALVALFLFPSD